MTNDCVRAVFIETVLSRIYVQPLFFFFVFFFFVQFEGTRCSVFFFFSIANPTGKFSRLSERRCAPLTASEHTSADYGYVTSFAGEET